MNDIFCPYCHSDKAIKKGFRLTQKGMIQLYRCKSCKRIFNDVRIPKSHYDPSVVYHAITYYHQGHTLKDTSIYINKKFKVNTGKTTVYYWIKRYIDITPIFKIRNRFFVYDQLVVSRSFKHENLSYEFMCHRCKLKAYAEKRYPNLMKYILGFENGCPDEFFEVGERCSQPKFKVDVNVESRVNLACRMADFAVKSRISNRDRHSLVENFMLKCDTATVACELPVWYWEKSIDSGITGHIDMLQIRGGNIIILDYKPGASSDKKAAQQLYHYAVALSFRTGVPFEKIRCAWFDEAVYYEYSPSSASVNLIKWKK